MNNSINLTILRSDDPPLHIDVEEDSNIHMLNEKLSEITGIEVGKFILSNENGDVVNYYIDTPIHKIISNNNTLHMNMAIYPHPKTIMIPFCNKPYPLWRYNEAYENKHPDEIPENLRDSAIEYFGRKENVLQDFYNQFTEGRAYLHQRTQSIQYWIR